MLFNSFSQFCELYICHFFVVLLCVPQDSDDGAKFSILSIYRDPLNGGTERVGHTIHVAFAKQVILLDGGSTGSKLHRWSIWSFDAGNAHKK